MSADEVSLPCHHHGLLFGLHGSVSGFQQSLLLQGDSCQHARLLNLLKGRNFPCSFKRSFIWPIQSHGDPKRPIGRGQPVRLFFCTGRFMLNIDRQSPVSVLLKVGQHRRVDQVTVDGIGHHQTLGQFVHRHRPKRMDRRILARLKAQRIAMLRRVEGRTIGIHSVHWINRLVFREAIDAENRTGKAV